MDTRFTIAWICWGVAFAIIEGLALYLPRKGDTLSEHVWWLMKCPPVWFAVAGLLVWLTLHFLTGGKV